MVRRSGIVVNGLTVLGLLLVVVLSCNEVERHQVLTFFFDGVPPPDGEANTQDNRMDTDRRGRRLRQVGERPEKVWFVHEPWKNRSCNLCHKRLDQVQWALPELTAPVPILCYDCHPGSNYAGSVDYVHGPVAIGDCLRCHKPHKSKQKYLMKIPVPDVCYQCHEKADIESIADHSIELLSECLECHIGHSSSARGLLKKGWDAEIKADSNESPDSRLGDELLKLLRDDMLKKGWDAEIKADSNEGPDSRLKDELLKLLRDDI